MADEKFNGEVRINKDISKYTDTALLGLSFKQTVFGGAAIVVSGSIFFFCHNTLGNELTTWLCVLAALPIGAIGFVKFNGMSFMQLVGKAVRHFKTPDILVFRGNSYLAELHNNFDELEKQKDITLRGDDNK